VRNQPGHFLPIILKTGIDRNGLIRLLHGDYRDLNVRVDLFSLFFQILCFYNKKIGIEHTGKSIPETRKFRSGFSHLYGS
jgi:hypothetical protein